MSVKNAMISDFLHSAYGGESMAHMRYLIWGQIAKREGFPNIAKLFEAISYAERVHAANHFREIGGSTSDSAVTAGAVFGIGKTVENLQFQNEAGAERSFRYALEAEKIHAALFKEAQDAAEEGKDIELSAVYICPVCGHTILNGAPDNCPVCGVKKELYVKF